MEDFSFNYFKPFNKNFKACEEFTSLSLKCQILTIGLSSLAALGTFFMFGLGAVAVFRYCVGKWTPIHLDDHPKNSTITKVNSTGTSTIQKRLSVVPSIITDPLPNDAEINALAPWPEYSSSHLVDPLNLYPDKRGIPSLNQIEWDYLNNHFRQFPKEKKEFKNFVKHYADAWPFMKPLLQKLS